MSRILCDNLANSDEDKKFVQPRAFMTENLDDNLLTSCSDFDSIPALDFIAFKQEGSAETTTESLNDQIRDLEDLLD